MNRRASSVPQSSFASALSCGVRTPMNRSRSTFGTRDALNAAYFSSFSAKSFSRIVFTAWVVSIELSIRYLKQYETEPVMSASYFP